MYEQYIMKCYVFAAVGVLPYYSITLPVLTIVVAAILRQTSLWMKLLVLGICRLLLLLKPEWN